jgi:hypothetical protein
MATDFHYILPKKYLIKYGVNGALILSILKSKYDYFSSLEMLEEDGSFYFTIKEIESNTGLGVNTIKRILPQLKDEVEVTTKEWVHPRFKKQSTFFARFSRVNPNGYPHIPLSSLNISIDGKMVDEGYHFLLNSISTENVKHLVKLMENGWLPNDISRNHTLGKIHTIYQIEAVYNVFYLK